VNVSLLIDWLYQFAKGVGWFFVNPLFYFFAIMSLFYGHTRIKRERKTFHTRVKDITDELKFTYTKGIIAGLLVSILLCAVGIVLPIGILFTISIFMVLFSFMFRMSTLSSAYTLGLTILIGFAVNTFLSAPDQTIPQLSLTNWTGLAVLLGILLLTEGYLAYRSAHTRMSPAIAISNRGSFIGRQIANRVWLLPLFLFIPGDGINIPFDWWPVFSVNSQSFIPVWIPYFLGFSQRVQGSLPKVSMQLTARRICILGLITLLCGICSYFWNPLALAAAAAAVGGRAFLSWKQRVNDNSAPYYFSKRNQGLMVLGIIPQTPAEDMNLEVGEIVTKVNGMQVRKVTDFYEALERNRTFIKMEIIDCNGQIRFEQRASYEGEHHELGILFVKEDDEIEFKQSRYS
jgi:tetrahydromethanopterin S-methyltransferase subunit F